MSNSKLKSRLLIPLESQVLRRGYIIMFLGGFWREGSVFTICMNINHTYDGIYVLQVFWGVGDDDWK